MTATLESLGIDRLSVEDRLQLIELIWDSLPPTVEPGEVPAWHLAELEKHREAATAQPGAGRPWRDVVSDLGATR